MAPQSQLFAARLAATAADVAPSFTQQSILGTFGQSGTIAVCQNGIKNAMSSISSGFLFNEQQNIALDNACIELANVMVDILRGLPLT